MLETLRFLYMVLSFIADTGCFEDLSNVPGAVSEHPLYDLAIPLLMDKQLHSIMELEDLRKRSVYPERMRHVGQLTADLP